MNKSASQPSSGAVSDPTTWYQQFSGSRSLVVFIPIVISLVFVSLYMGGSAPQTKVGKQTTTSNVGSADPLSLKVSTLSGISMQTSSSDAASSQLQPSTTSPSMPESTNFMSTGSNAAVGPAPASSSNRLQNVPGGNVLQSTQAALGGTLHSLQL